MQALFSGKSERMSAKCMNLQRKAILFFDLVLLVSCLILSVLGYRSANEGFQIALQEKAHSDIRQSQEILNLSYPGNWQIENGVLYKGEQKINDASDIVDHLKELTGNNITIFSGDTRVTTTFEQNGKRSVGTQASQKIIDIVLTQGKSFTGEAEVLGNHYFCAYEPIKDSSGKTIGMLFMGIPSASVELLQKDFLLSSGSVTVVLIILLGFMIFYVVRRTLNPLEEVSLAMQQIAKGILDNKPLAISGNDEISRIAASTNEMQESIAGIIKEIVSSAHQVAAASQQLTASASQTSDSVNQVSQNVVGIAGDTEKQSSSLEEISKQSLNMSNEMKALHQSSESMQHVAEQSRTGAREGHEAVTNVMNAMNKMRDKMKESVTVVSALDGQSKEISKIIETITAIAEQTNLLALNAAIEAARAGSAGRGFAVVADEVRKLAEQSGIAAQNIASIVTEIQNNTVQAMEAVKKENEEVELGTNIVQSTGDVFSRMEHQVDELYKQIQISREYMLAADHECADIAENIQIASDVSRTVAQEAQNVSAATEEQTAMTHDIADASESLANLAQKLQNQVSHFRF